MYHAYITMYSIAETVFFPFDARKKGQNNPIEYLYYQNSIGVCLFVGIL